MKFSYNWLQEHIEEKLPPAAELSHAIIFHMTEVESVEPAGDDTILDINILPNRAGDCLSHAGMAREIAGLYGYTFKEAETVPIPDGLPPVQLDSRNDRCRAYTAVHIDGVKVGPSPDWLKAKLESIGQRSVNNIVDATNYVLFDLGQPVHAFDAAGIDGGIVVRNAHGGETIRLLGGEEKALQETDLVIADYMGAIAIAGVKGGATAEVSEQTTSVIVEVANFDPVSVRTTSRRLNLITDASKRFENNLSPAFVPAGAAKVTALILQLAGGKVSGLAAQGSTDMPQRTVACTLRDVTRLLGSSVTDAAVGDVLKRYGYAHTKEGDSYVITIPHYRADLAGAHDIAEEIGRSIGFDAIPASPLPFTPVPLQNETDAQMSAVRAWAIQNGYREVYTYAFRPKGEVAVAYGAKGKDKLRANLSDGLKESYDLNRLNGPLLGIDDVRLFEIGTVFSTDAEAVHVATCDRGTIQELPIGSFIAERGIDIAGPVSIDGALQDPQQFAPWSAYPFIVRDIAVWVSDEEGTGRLASMVREFAKGHCVREPQLFDTFTKDGRTSVAYRFVFQSPDRTLTDEEVSERFSLLTQQVAADPAFAIR